MTIQIYVLLASGRFEGFADSVRSSVRRTCSLVEQALPLANVDIVVRDDRFRFIPEWGIGGFTPDAHTVQINLDAARIDEVMLNERLPRCVAHELHHAGRWLNPGYGLQLFEAIVTEGLADHFASELLNQSQPPWAGALADDDVPTVKAIAESDLDASLHDHQAWFFGSQPNRIPRWAGYSLGWRVVEHHLGREPGCSSAALVAEPAASFRTDWESL